MHPDEGTIHGYVEGQLPVAEQEAVAGHIASCAQCSAAVAEARGIIAAASRIVTALDDVPANVIPARRFRRLPPWVAAAAALLLAVGVTSVMWRPGQEVPLPRETAGISEDVAVASPVAPVAETESTIVATPATATATRRPSGAGARASTAGPASSLAAVQQVAPVPAAPPPQAPPSPPQPPPPPPPPAAGSATDPITSGAVGMQSARASALSGEEATATRSRATTQADRTTVAGAAPAPTGAAALRQQVPGLLRVVRYDAGSGIVELSEYDAAFPPAPPGDTQPAGINEHRWTDAAETRVYVLTGPFTAAELEQLARRLKELPVVP